MLVMFGKVARIYPNFLLFPGVMIRYSAQVIVLYWRHI